MEIALGVFAGLVLFALLGRPVVALAPVAIKAALSLAWKAVRLVSYIALPAVLATGAVAGAENFGTAGAIAGAALGGILGGALRGFVRMVDKAIAANAPPPQVAPEPELAAVATLAGEDVCWFCGNEIATGAHRERPIGQDCIAKLP
jgi:hypothetical protein